MASNLTIISRWLKLNYWDVYVQLLYSTQIEILMCDI